MFSGFEEQVIEALRDCKGIVKHCAINAVGHIRKAGLLVGVDNEMAAFRAITAEEEAATALIHSLRVHRYKNAEQLKPNMHAHKLGISPLIEACMRHLLEFMGQEESPFDKWSLSIERTGSRRALRLGLKIRGLDRQVNPQPPLHFVISGAHSGGYDAGEVLRRYLEKEDSHQVQAHISAIANQRNLLLYASPSGAATVDDAKVRNFISGQKVRAMRLLYVVMLSDPWVSTEGKSGFLQQVLDSYLVLLKRIVPEAATDLKEIKGFNRTKSRAAPAPDAATSAGAESS